MPCTRLPAVLLLSLSGLAAAVAPAAASASARPDLVVAKPGAAVRTLTIGAPATLAIGVRNSGRATAGASKLGLYLSRDARLSPDDIAVGSARAGRLRRGTTTLLRLRWVVPATVSPATTYVLLACADAGKAVRESRETGNCRVLLKARPVSGAAPSGAPAPAVPSTPATPPAAPGTPAPDPTPAGLIAGGCRIFPAGNPWERDVRSDPLDPNSAQIITNEAGAAGPSGRKLFVYGDPDPTSGVGIPVNVTPASTAGLPVTFALDGDAGPYPIAANALIEGWMPGAPDPGSGTDRHLISVQQGTCRLAELYDAQRTSIGQTVTGYEASQGMLLDLKAPYNRPAGKLGTVMAGMPQLPGLLRQADLESGSVDHALYVILPANRHAYLPPANACGTTGQNGDTYLPMGGRLRLKATFDTTPYSGGALAILRAMQRYGVMLADRGGGPSLMPITAEPGAQLTGVAAQLLAHPVTLADFEALSTAGASTTGC